MLEQEHRLVVVDAVLDVGPKPIVSLPALQR
jgi:hypothetical protein